MNARSSSPSIASRTPKLKKRTLTNLYNERPAWLRLARATLDRAVLAAYAATDPRGGWTPDWAATYEPFGAGEITVRNRGTKAIPADSPEVQAAKQTTIAARATTDAAILTALLRLNVERANQRAVPDTATPSTRQRTPRPERAGPKAPPKGRWRS